MAGPGACRARRLGSRWVPTQLLEGGGWARFRRSLANPRACVPPAAVGSCPRHLEGGPAVSDFLAENSAFVRCATIPERDDQIAHRRKKPGRPIDFGDDQKERYKGRNVVERCLNRLKQWRGIAMRSDKFARNYRAAICLAATLIWIKTDLINTA